MTITYDGGRGILHLGKNESESFYCGSVLNELACVLIRLQRGEATLQDTYTLLAQNLHPDRIDNLQ